LHRVMQTKARFATLNWQSHEWESKAQFATQTRKLLKTFVVARKHPPARTWLKLPQTILVPKSSRGAPLRDPFFCHLKKKKSTHATTRKTKKN
jgi:hypothetical protein